MAKHLASIYGTEEDRVNCPFYNKMGACRHGDRCSRLHTKPSISPTLLLCNMYQRPDMITPGIDPHKIQEHFENFYEDLFEELSKYGKIRSLNVCDNLNDHLVGNVYVQFKEEELASNALRNLTGRFYEGRPIIVEFSPVSNFDDATCRQYELNSCDRGGYCNFMHLKKIRSDLKDQLFGSDSRKHARSRSRSRSPNKQRSYEERSHGSRHGRRYDDRNHHDAHIRHQRGRNTKYGGRSNCLEREGSAERRAKIERWNTEREKAGAGNSDNQYINKNSSASTGDTRYDDDQDQQKQGEHLY